MINYILAATSEMSDDTEDKIGSMSNEEIGQRLGSNATDADTILFSKLWKAMFTYCTAAGFDDGLPVFYDREDFDTSWAECVAIMHEGEV